MAAVDHETAIIERLWAILEGRAAFTAEVKPGNRIKLIGAAARAPIKVAPADFPKVIIYIASIGDALYTLGESFAMRAGATFTPATQGVATDLLYGVAIDIFHGDSFASARQLVAEIMTGIRIAGPALGITAFRVQRVGPASQQNQNSFNVTGELGVAGAKPVRTTIGLPVLVRTKTQDLLA